MRILILGPQGSGKGTQAKRIAAAHGIAHVSTGDILRAAVAEETELGNRVAPILERGDLVPDELMIDLIRERLEHEDGFVLDGFPRTLAQAEALDSMLAGIGKPLDVVLLLAVGDDMHHRPRPRGNATVRGDQVEDLGLPRGLAHRPQSLGRAAQEDVAPGPVARHQPCAGLAHRTQPFQPQLQP